MNQASPICRKKISIEMKQCQLQKDPLIIQRFDPNNILNCYYIFIGPKDTPYEGGMYFGKVTLPFDYPFRPPSIEMFTPSGRFKPNQKICISISNFHPETWSPSYNVFSVLMGLLSFMTGTDCGVGSFNDSDSKKRQYAKDSIRWNQGFKLFQDVFPEYC
ncbi:hypothetical protein ENUP19_0271G0001 [Entamoeba nuttalli]|uniref:UBC core domain-containing protein n=1 Tax=Entamoeba nuttalli TaxID=412467 RepID=A0ABQ0DSY5_9EUKA